MRMLPHRLLVPLGTCAALLGACVSTEPIPYEYDRDADDAQGSDIGALDALDRRDTNDETSRDVAPDDGTDDALGDTARDSGTDPTDAADDGSGLRPNSPPTAVVPPSATAWVEVPFTLDGSASFDPDPGDVIVEYRWNLDDGRTFLGATRDVLFDTEGDFGGALTVTDGNGASHSASFSVTVTEKPPGPTAIIGPDDAVATVGVPFGLDGSASSSPDGAIVTWDWTVTDPSGAVVAELEGANPVHTFTSAGPHAVQLAVVDDSGSRGGAEREFYAGVPPLARIEVTPDPPEERMNILLSGSASTDADDAIVAYAWRLPDGTETTGLTTTFTTTTPGTLTFALRVTDEHGLEGTTIREVEVVPSTLANLPPLCDLGPARTLVVGEAAALDATCTDSEGAVATIAWDFDDGGTAEGARVFHSWASAGIYTVTATATDELGAEAAYTVVVTVTQPLRSPVAAFTWSPTTVAPGTPASFDASATSDPDGDAIIEYRWDFGDGSSTEFGPTPVHVFGTAGTYTVTLDVLDARGSTGRATRTITIDCAPACLAGNYRVLPLDAELDATGYCADGSTSITVSPQTCAIGFVGTSMTMQCGADIFYGTLSGRTFDLALYVAGGFDAWCGTYSVSHRIRGTFVTDTRWEGTALLVYAFDDFACYGCDFDPYLTTGTRLP